MTSDERLARYSDIVVRIGANVQSDQSVVILAQVEHALVARAIAAAAYRAGARRVDVEYSDLHVRRSAIEFGPEDELGRSRLISSSGSAAGPMSALRRSG